MSALLWLSIIAVWLVRPVRTIDTSVFFHASWLEQLKTLDQSLFFTVRLASNLPLTWDFTTDGRRTLQLLFELKGESTTLRRLKM